MAPSRPRSPRCPAADARRPAALLLALLALLAPLATAAQDAAADDRAGGGVDYSSMNLEQLMDIEVTSLAKRPQKLNEAAAAIFVITQEDIRTSGATNIPELLRMAPGVQVAQLDANKWAISIRGFNGRYANKLLVMQDGRNLYTPVFGGVFWDVQDTMLQDIERIEVIRGPGGTMWGTNAVNGVINIITKNAKDTQGLLTYGEYGSEIGSAGVRYGAKVGDDLAWRAFAKYTRRDESALASGQSASDAWDQERMGFRSDWDPRPGDKVSVSGEAFRSNDMGTPLLEYTLAPPYQQLVKDDGNSYGGYLLGNWQHDFTADSKLTLTSYYDWYKTSQRAVSNELGTFDLDLQHDIGFDFLTRHLFSWGFEYRRYVSNTKDSGDERLVIHPSRRDDNLLSAFLQNQITLIDDTLLLTLGSKFQHSEAGGFDVQPSARLIWTPDERQSVWGAVSRGVRSPSFGEQNADLLLGVVPPNTPQNPGPLPIAMIGDGNPSLKSEKVLAYELGYRTQPLDNLSIDVAGFYNVYDRLNAFQTGTPTPVFAPPPPRINVPVTANNMGSGDAYGGELAVTFDPLRWLSLRGAYSYLKLDFDGGTAPFEGRSPLHQASLRALVELDEDWDLDLWLRYVDKLSEPTIDSYVTGDVRLAWRPTAGVELSIVGQNLFNDQQQQFPADYNEQLPGEVERSVYGKIEIKF